MTPSNTCIAAQLRHLIYYHLDNDLVENALFLAGRLHALEPKNPDAAHLFALCNFRLGRYRAAYTYAKERGARGQHLGCAYVFAQTCLELGSYYGKGIDALDRARGFWVGRSHWSETFQLDVKPSDNTAHMIRDHITVSQSDEVDDAVTLISRVSASPVEESLTKEAAPVEDDEPKTDSELTDKHSETSRRHLPDAAAVTSLLGKLWKANGDTKKATTYFVEALKLNPFMWDAFLQLCETGVVVRSSNIFNMTPEMMAFLSCTRGYSDEPHPPPEALQEDSSNINKNSFISTPDIDPFNPSVRAGNDVGLNLGGSNLLSKLNGTNVNGNFNQYPEVETPISNGQNGDDDVMMGEAVSSTANEQGDEPPQAPLRKQRTLQSFITDAPGQAPRMKPITTRSRLKTGSETSETTEIPRPAGVNGHKRTVSGHAPQSNSTTQQPDPTAAPQRRSVRLLSQISQIRPSSSRLAAAAGREAETRERRELRKAKATGTRGRTTATSTVGRIVSGNRKPIDLAEANSKESLKAPSVTSISLSKPATAPISAQQVPLREQEALQWLLDLFCKLGDGYAHLCRYECQQALQAFASVPTQQRETPWVLSQIGKAYYEKSSFAEAEDVFFRVVKMAPFRMEDMEVYSNVLWQLKNENRLAYLSHILVEADRLSPQAWCALGNAFSLQREHDQAIKCFKRATQLDSKFAYAFTLQGHEHVANEEFDKAMYAYRCAISADSRHYNGWYGLGQVYEKMGKYDVAEQHYRSAAQINPTNALLALKIGAVLDRMKKTQAALIQYTHAVDMDPRYKFARFRRGQALMKLRQPREALEELVILKDLAPDDPNVHFILGRLYKMMKNKTDAIRHFTIALNLDPKASALIKEAMESLEDDDEVGDWSDEDR